MTDITKTIQATQTTESISDAEVYYIDSVNIINTTDGTESTGIMPIRVDWEKVVVPNFFESINLDLSLKDLFIGNFQIGEDGKIQFGEYDSGFLSKQSIVQFLKSVKEGYDKEFWGAYDSEGKYVSSFVNYDAETNIYSLKDWNEMTPELQTIVKNMGIDNEAEWIEISGELNAHSFMQILLNRAFYWKELPTERYDSTETVAIANFEDINEIFNPVLEEDVENG